MSYIINHRRPTVTSSFAGVEIHAADGVHEAALEVLDRVLEPGARIADLGAGSGAFSARLKRAGYEPVAVDLKIDACPDDIPFVEADITNLSRVFESESLPAAVALESIEHLPDPLNFLREVHRILVPGGLFLATTPNVTHLYSRLRFALKGTFYQFGPESYKSIGPGHITPLPEWLFRKHLMRAGFEGIEYGLAGWFHFHGVKRAVTCAMRNVPCRTKTPLGHCGDGCNVIILGRKPQTSAGPR